jgi:hypothetical protein
MCWEFNINVYQIYVDFKQAYDNIQREKLYRIMHEFNIPNKLIRLVRATVRNSETQVKIQTQLTEPFKIRQGLKQGDGLAPSLFNLSLEYAIKKLTGNVKGTLEFEAIQVVGYADDICLLSRNIRTIKEELMEAAMEIGLKINKDKTLAMIQTRSKASKANIGQQLHAGEHSIKIVDSYHYLGSCITNDNDEAAEIQRRLKLANSTCYSISSIMKSQDVHKGTKIRLYKTLIRTVLTYGCETWRLSKQSEKTIGIFERKILPMNIRSGERRGTMEDEIQQGTLRTIQGCRPCNLH